MENGAIEAFFKGKESSESAGMALLARFCREFYENLTELGFEPLEALELVKAYLTASISLCGRAQT